jgi:hypothetical protein
VKAGNYYTPFIKILAAISEIVSGNKVLYVELNKINCLMANTDG